MKLTEVETFANSSKYFVVDQKKIVLVQKNNLNWFKKFCTKGKN